MLFRHDSIATKTVRNFFRMIAPNYLKKAISPLLQETISALKKTDEGGTSGYYMFELAEEKLKQKEDLQVHIDYIMKLCQQYLDTIIDSIDYLPL